VDVTQMKAFINLWTTCFAVLFYFSVKRTGARDGNFRAHL
jgi:hypothetical protein